MAKKKTNRDDDISSRPAIAKRILDLADVIGDAFADQRERSDENVHRWDLYNNKLTRQFYHGESEIFVPIIADAVGARVTRFVNQIFPQSGRYVDVTCGETDIPYATMALLESYVTAAKLRTRIMPALVKQGDIEGQYTLYVSWEERKRYTVGRVKKPVEAMGAQIGEVDDLEEEVVTDAWPMVEIIADADWVCTPLACDSIAEAIAYGGAVGIVRRWSKGRIQQAIDDGDITKEAGSVLKDNLAKRSAGKLKDPLESSMDAAGIKKDARGCFAQVYEIWAMFQVDGDSRLCRAYYGGQDAILGAKLNPYWCDLCPLITAPVEKIAGMVKGKAPVAKVESLQILANDTVNMGADTGMFSAMPIIMTDPDKNPRIESMVLGLAAIWQTSPTDTQFAEFPEMWATMMNRVSVIKEQIMQSLGVNPAMMPQGTGGDSSRNQAEIATEQQVDIMTTADACTVLEEGILTPLLGWFAALDSQFRDENVTVQVYGEPGIKAAMEDVEPLQLNKRFQFKWLGVEAARNASQMQQQIAWVNVMKGIPPQMYEGYKLNMSPLLVQGTENMFGPRLAPLIFAKDDPVGVDPMLENELMNNGFVTDTHPGDDDQMHIQVHMQGMQMGDPMGLFKQHIQAHQIQMQAKAAQQQAQMQPQGGAPGLPGTPGGAGPGVAGAPRPGAQPQGPRLIKGPEGMIPPEQMPAAGAIDMPRKM